MCRAAPVCRNSFFQGIRVRLCAHCRSPPRNALWTCSPSGEPRVFRTRMARIGANTIAFLFQFSLASSRSVDCPPGAAVEPECAWVGFAAIRAIRVLTNAPGLTPSRHVPLGETQGCRTRPTATIGCRRGSPPCSRRGSRQAAAPCPRGARSRRQCTGGRSW